MKPYGTQVTDQHIFRSTSHRTTCSTSCADGHPRCIYPWRLLAYHAGEIGNPTNQSACSLRVCMASVALLDRASIALLCEASVSKLQHLAAHDFFPVQRSPRSVVYLVCQVTYTAWGLSMVKAVQRYRSNPTAACPHRLRITASDFFCSAYAVLVEMATGRNVTTCNGEVFARSAAS